MIEHFTFGSMTIDGKRYQSDLKIVGGQVVSKWWRRESHSLEEADIDDILSAKPDVFVVGTGQPGRMQVTGSLRSVLADAKIQLIEEPTAEAFRTFNRLSKEGRNVAAAFHMTC